MQGPKHPRGYTFPKPPAGTPPAGTGVRSIHRTAGYGPVCPVVWEGRSRETPPIPISVQVTPVLQPVKDLVGPEPLEPLQRLVEAGELGGADATHLLDRAHVLVIQRLDDVAHLAALVGELDADRASIDAR